MLKLIIIVLLFGCTSHPPSGASSGSSDAPVVETSATPLRLAIPKTNRKKHVRTPPTATFVGSDGIPVTTVRTVAQ